MASGVSQRESVIEACFSEVDGSGFLEFEQTVAEVFDVQLLSGVRNPALIGFGKETIERACTMPPL